MPRPKATDPLVTLRATLEDRRRTLRTEVEAVKSERSAAPTLVRGDLGDAAEVGEERSRDAVRSAEELRDTAELRDIDAALHRLDDGSYGVCNDCGITIPLERLKAQPTAERCIDCQERHERRHPPQLRAAPMH